MRAYLYSRASYPTFLQLSGPCIHIVLHLSNVSVSMIHSSLQNKALQKEMHK